jgi:hypothetical protein
LKPQLLLLKSSKGLFDLKRLHVRMQLFIVQHKVAAHGVQLLKTFM